MLNSFKTTGPHIENNDTIEKNMWNVSLALLPASIFAIVFFGFYSLYIILGTALAAVCFEIPFNLKSFNKKTPLGDGSAFLAGMLLGLTLPPQVPWWIPIIGGFFTIVIAKQLFGGVGNNIFNPALVARALLMLSWPSHLTTWFKPFDGVSTATPLVEGLSDTISSATNQIATETIGYYELFMGNVAGSIGETSALALLIGAIYLYFKGYIAWRIPLSYIVSAGTLAYFLGLDPLFTILSGGLLFGALFMSTDMVTSPTTKNGRLVYGVACGLLTVIIREFTVYPEGVTFAILIMNAFSYLLDTLLEGPKFGQVEKQKQKLYKLGTLVLATIVFTFIAYSGFFISNQLETSKSSIYISGVYTGSGQGMNDEIKIELIVEDGKITAIEVLDHSDTERIAKSAFQKLSEKIITEQNIEIDIISGATLSSQGFLEAVQAALD